MINQGIHCSFVQRSLFKTLLNENIDLGFPWKTMNINNIFVYINVFFISFKSLDF